MIEVRDAVVPDEVPLVARCSEYAARLGVDLCFRVRGRTGRLARRVRGPAGRLLLAWLDDKPPDVSRCDHSSRRLLDGLFDADGQ